MDWSKVDYDEMEATLRAEKFLDTIHEPYEKRYPTTEDNQQTQ